MNRQTAFDLHEQRVDNLIHDAMCNAIDTQKTYIERLENDISALKSVLRQTTSLNLYLTSRLSFNHEFRSALRNVHHDEQDFLGV